jgi:hypothetical protein
MATNLLLAAAGLYVLYLAPGLGLAAALFPEKFHPRSDRWLAWMELAVLGVILSVSVTILWGELLQTIGPGFSASWSSPTLLLADGGTAAVGFSVGAIRGAFRSSKHEASLPSEAPGDLAAWPTLRELERMAREERRLTRALERPGLENAERSVASQRLESIRAARERLRRAREAEYAA